jgi:hypothetical protein
MPGVGELIYYCGSPQAFGVVEMVVRDVLPVEGEQNPLRERSRTIIAQENGSQIGLTIMEPWDSRWLHATRAAATEHAIQDLTESIDRLTQRKKQLGDDLALYAAAREKLAVSLELP